MGKPLKILHLFDFYLPGTMNWAYQLLRHTSDVVPSVAAPWVVRNEYFDQDFHFYIRDIQQIPGLNPDNEQSLEWLSTNLIRMERVWPVYKNWLFQQLKNNRPDVLHAHFGPVGCHYIGLADKLGIPMVVSFYGYDFQRVVHENPEYKTRYKRLFQRAEAVTTTGPFTPALLVLLGCPREKITPVPLPVPLAGFPWRERKKLAGSLRLIQIATITAKKGHLDTLEALRLALPNCPNLHLTIAGERQDKNLVGKMQRFIRSYKLEHYIQWLDSIPHGGISSLLSEYDVFIHPSHQTANMDNEGAPVVILEAQATGLPVISTTHADIPAQVLHGVSGMLSPEHSPEQLAQSIERFYLMENNEYQQFSRAARRHMETHYDSILVGEKLAKLYKSLLVIR